MVYSRNKGKYVIHIECIYVTDKVEDFVEDKNWALNCILNCFPDQSFSQRNELEGRVKLLFRCITIKTEHSQFLGDLNKDKHNMDILKANCAKNNLT